MIEWLTGLPWIAKLIGWWGSHKTHERIADATEKGSDAAQVSNAHQAVYALLAKAEGVVADEQWIKKAVEADRRRITQSIANSALGGPTAQQMLRRELLDRAQRESTELAKEAREIIAKGENLVDESPGVLLRYSARMQQARVALGDIRQQI